jgi:2-polyprenyl-3-methyl-5-hydroxy-6-metoxy-1,4-benzoquinol methylase
MEDSSKKREISFHDEWADGTSLSEIKVFESFENITAQENRFILSLMGDLENVKLLDIGAGLGESSVYFALKRARVTAVDISPAMLGRCTALGEKYGVNISTILDHEAQFEYGEAEYDIVYGANVLHHIGDIKPLLKGVKRSLVPEGQFFFYDPLAYNPAINVYRRLATNVRTKDEQPLRFSHLKHFRELFSEVHYRGFWLSTLFLFFKYYFIDRVHPNTERYWKRIFEEDPNHIGWWFNPLQRLDSVMLRIPPIKYLAWNIVIWGRK